MRSLLRPLPPSSYCHRSVRESRHSAACCLHRSVAFKESQYLLWCHKADCFLTNPLANGAAKQGTRSHLCTLSQSDLNDGVSQTHVKTGNSSVLQAARGAWNLKRSDSEVIMRLQ